MIRLPSASSLDRAIECLPSNGLLGVESIDPGEAAAKGTTVHAFLAAVLSGSKTRDEALEDVALEDPGRALCEAIDLEQLPTGGQIEPAFAWDVATGKGRIIGHDIGRDYEAHGADRSREFVGSADFAGLRADGKAIVLDWKTGWGTGKAKDSWQLRGLGLFAAETLGATSAIVGHVYVRDEKPVFDLVELDEMELGAIRAELRALRSRMAALMASAEPVTLVREGAHCTYCPAFKSCPAKTGLVRSMHTDLDVREPFAGALTPANAAEVVKTLLRFEDVAKRMWKELEVIAAEAPIDLGDGRVMKLAPGRSADAIVNAGAALGCLESVCDTQTMNAAMTTTKTAIEEAARAWAVANDKPIGKTQAAVMNLARETKAIEKRPGAMSVRVVKS